MSTQSTSQFSQDSLPRGPSGRSLPAAFSQQSTASSSRGVASRPALRGPANLGGGLNTPLDNTKWLNQVHTAMQATVNDEEEQMQAAGYVRPLETLLSTVPPAERMDDIKKLLHPAFRMRCFDVLLSVFETATKLVGVESAIRALERQKFEKKLPAAVTPIAKAKVATQFTSLYPAELKEQAAREMAVLTAKYAAELHETIITQKKAEYKYLKALIAQDEILKRLYAAIRKDFLGAKLQHGSHPGQEDVDMDIGDAPTESRDQRDIAGDITTPPFLLVERDAAMALAPLLAVRVLEMAHTRQANRDYVIEKKTSLKDKTILRVAQEAPESEEARLVRLIKGVVLGMDKSGPKAKNVRGTSGPVDFAPLTFLDQEQARTPQGETQATRGEKIGIKRKRESNDSPIPSREAVGASEQQQEEAIAKRRKKCREEAEVRRLIAIPFSFDNPSSYPDQILTLPPFLQTTVLAAKANKDFFVNVRRFWPGPHVQDGVFVPDWVKYELGVNLKYLYPVTFNKELLNEAFNDFTYRIRWAYFWNKSDKIDDESWNADFKVRKARREPPKMSQVLERGLEAGRQTLISMCVKPPRSTLRQDRRPRWKELSNLLESSNLMIKGSDKNLGPVIFERDWYIKEVEALLSDRSNYRELDTKRVGVPDIVRYEGRYERHEAGGLHFVSRMRECFDSVAHRFMWLANTLHESQKAIEEWLELAQLILPSNELEFLMRWKDDADVPRFHGIPKIHKSPWKIRPIAPGHSWVTSPLAKWVQVALKNVTKAIPWLATSTGDVTRLLNLVELPEGRAKRNLYVCTGDVVAMYPNIPNNSDRIVGEILELFREHLPGHLQAHIGILTLAISVVNRFTVVEFNNKFYAQIKGLAMGAACSPDVANLYAAYYELADSGNFRSRNASTGNGIIFYTRYIDDVLAIIQADSLEECRAHLDRHNLGPVLQTEWTITREGEGPSPYLDLDLDILPGETRVDYKLFRKPFNHFMRIPWESAHPVAVKRAGFVGKLTRLATCSSRKSSYETAVAEYRDLLIARGYPRQVLHCWARNEVEKRWGLAKKPEEVEPIELPPLILKTEYNDAWNGVDIDSVKAAMLDAWISDRTISKQDRIFAESIRDRRVLISYKRTRNLQDDVSVLNAKLSRMNIDDFREIVDRGANDLAELVTLQRREEDDETEEDN